MNKVHVLSAITPGTLEHEINNFANEREIVNVTLTSNVYGYLTEYIAAVVYKEDSPCIDCS